MVKKLPVVTSIGKGRIITSLLLTSHNAFWWLAVPLLFPALDEAVSMYTIVRVTIDADNIWGKLFNEAMFWRFQPGTVTWL